MSGVFVTGTDTGVGKTVVCGAILRGWAAQGLRAVGMKPVASGCRVTPDGPRSDDAEELTAAANVDVNYADVNPYALVPAIAPHLAAAAAGCEIRFERVLRCYQTLAARADRVAVEGVGGWRVPLAPHCTVADLARALELPVVLVVGIRLGCLNHALLSMEAIERSGVRWAGWVANHCDADVEAAVDNVAALRKWLGVPPLGELRYVASGRSLRLALP